MSTKQYETMSEYIAGFDAGYSFVLEEIGRHINLTPSEILRHLRGEKIEIGPSIPAAREKDKQCD